MQGWSERMFETRVCSEIPNGEFCTRWCKAEYLKSLPYILFFWLKNYHCHTKVGVTMIPLIIYIVVGTRPYQIPNGQRDTQQNHPQLGNTTGYKYIQVMGSETIPDFGNSRPGMVSNVQCPLSIDQKSLVKQQAYMLCVNCKRAICCRWLWCCWCCDWCLWPSYLMFNIVRRFIKGRCSQQLNPRPHMGRMDAPPPQVGFVSCTPCFWSWRSDFCYSCFLNLL